MRGWLDSISPSDEQDNSVPSTLESRSIVISTCSSGPPAVGIAANSQFDWILSLREARRHIAAYMQVALHAVQVPVHLIVLRYEQTAAMEAMCPLGLLQETSPISDFSAWCERFSFALSSEYSRVFPVIGEVFQNVPSLVIVHALPNDMVPLVVLCSSRILPMLWRELPWLNTGCSKGSPSLHHM